MLDIFKCNNYYMTDKFPDLTVSQCSPILIAGPCSAESPEQMLATAKALSSLGIVIFRAGVWKPRTRPGGFEGYGKEALKWLDMVKKETGMLTATEIGCAAHACEALKAGIDLLWIGARTSASPFAIQEIGECMRGSDTPVFVKNPVCADTDLWIGAIERLCNCGLSRLGAIHRGFKLPSSSIYRNPPLWELVDRFRQNVGEIPLLCDPSHMGGSRDLIFPLSSEAKKRGYDGLMIESHIYPDKALTDSAQQLRPADLSPIIDLWQPTAPIKTVSTLSSAS